MAVVSCDHCKEPFVPQDLARSQEIHPLQRLLHYDCWRQLLLLHERLDYEVVVFDPDLTAQRRYDAEVG